MEQAMNVTRVYYNVSRNFDTMTHIFGVNGNSRIDSIWVTGFEDGFIIVDPCAGYIFDEFVEVVSGCFNESSNFFDTVNEVLFIEKAAIKGIRFEFKGTVVSVTKENSDPKKIYEEWNSTMEANLEKVRQERLDWYNTPEGQQVLIEEAEEQKRRNILAFAVLTVDESFEMEFASKEGKKTWENLVKANDETYGAAVMAFARRWAKYMQVLISEGKSIEDIAEETSHICDLNVMYDCAIDALAKSWKYGEELRKWRNQGYDD